MGGPALRALTFHERAVMLKELGKHLMEHVAEFHELSLRTGATKGDGMGDIEGGIGTLFASGSVGTRQLPNDTVYLDGDPIPLGKGGTFVGQHVFTSRPGVMVQINAFNFPVWGMLEKLGPAFLAGMPSIVKPAAQTSYVTEAVVRRIVESGIVPEGSIQLLMGSPAGLLDELQVQDHVAFTGSAHTAGLLRTHTNVLHGGVTLGVEADSLNCSILGPDVTADDPELDLFVKGVVTEMTYKAGQKCTAIRRALVPRRHGRHRPRGADRAAGAGRPSATRPPRACGWARWSASTSARRCGRRSSRCAPPPSVVYGDPDARQSEVIDADARAGRVPRAGSAARRLPRGRAARRRGVRAGQHRDRLRHPRRCRRAGRARQGQPGRVAGHPRPRGRADRHPRRGSVARPRSWSSTATTPASPPATAYHCRRSSTAAPAGPAAARRWAGSAASCT